jgi:hypothetical protein
MNEWTHLDALSLGNLRHREPEFAENKKKEEGDALALDDFRKLGGGGL